MESGRTENDGEYVLGRTVHSIGHSNHPLEHFIGLLRQFRIATVADIRSEPYSRFSPHFDAGHLRAALEPEAIGYLFLGEELGGRPPEDAYYDAAGRVRYDRLAESRLFRDGLRRLRGELQTSRVAIMCSEEDPRECHRYLLVSRVLEREGVRVLHIRGDGRVQAAEGIEQEAARRRGDAGQLTLFAPTELAPWRSIRSVSPRRARPTSSER